MAREYVEQREDGLYVAGTRVSLDSIVYAFEQGSSPEAIQENWPSLTLEQVYGAVTYYLANRASVDDYLRRSEGLYSGEVPSMKDAAPALYTKLRKTRELSTKL